MPVYMNPLPYQGDTTIPVITNDWTFDSNDITMDSTERSFDEDD